MIDNNVPSIYTFQHTEDSKAVTVTIDNSNGTWVKLLREFTGFIAASYGYDIQNYIGIREFDFDNNERSAFFTPLMEVDD